MKNEILEKFKRGEKTIGTFTLLKSATAVEALGYTDFDFVVIDTEHTSVGVESAVEYISAAQNAGLTPMVRVNGVSRSPILRLLDAGAQALVVPCINTVEDVKEIVQYSKYTPLGSRGFCPTRDGGWGFADHAASGIENYMEYCNKNTLLIPQCETIGCLENIEEIVNIDGVDGILIGPFDLSIAMNKPAKFDDPEVKGAIKRILNACKEAGKIAFIFTGSVDDANKYLDEGFDCIGVGLDTVVYINAYRDIISKLKL
jgi:4-hydroxy-2-oxoheptanedioate aldolase